MTSTTTAADRSGLSALGRKILLDRYARKDQDRSRITESDVVVVKVDPRKEQREVAIVLAQRGEEVTVLLEDGSRVTVPREHVDRPLELTYNQVADRVVKAVARVETDDIRAEVEEEFRWLLGEGRFVPGGRILAAAGTDHELTYYNCYVLPSPKDSRGGIVETLGNMVEIFSRGGGVGVNISSLRPRYSCVRGVDGRSSGSVSWGSLYSFVTGLIEQGGSRRGALMLILNDWHPDLLEFVNAKREAGKITNANISVGISDRFMAQVERDGDWTFIYPDTTHPAYNEEWNGDIDAWTAKGYPTNAYGTMKARAIWQQITESAWASAEPGIWFRDRANALSNSYYYSPLVATNPCGEQSLPGWAVCNLGALNLPAFITESTEPNANTAYLHGIHNGLTVAWGDLRKAVRRAVRFLDDVIDATPYFFDENEQQQKQERRIGLGVMGFGELLVRLGIRYGSRESVEFTEELFKFLAVEAYTASAALAEEKGSFPAFQRDLFLGSAFVSKLPRNVLTEIRNKGMRNVTCLTIAPTGTTGTMWGTTTGIEPYFDWGYIRNTRVGEDRVIERVMQEWLDKKGIVYEDLQAAQIHLPPYFVTAMELSPEDHILVQAAAQRWIDSSISKTANVPADYTPAQVAELYALMHRLGVKGGTIYRDGSRDVQVLNRLPEPETPTPAQTQGEVAVVPVPRREPMEPTREALTHKFTVDGHEGYMTIGYYPDGRAGELFLRVAKAGSAVSGLLESLAIITSVAIQYGVPIEALEEKMSGVRFEPSGRTTNPALPLATSIVDYVYRYLGQHATHEAQAFTPPVAEAVVAKTPDGDLCPLCGEIMLRAAGCLDCRSCGFTKCG